MEALDFVDVGTVWFMCLGLVFLILYWTYKIIVELKSHRPTEPVVPPVCPPGPVHYGPYTDCVPTLTEPVGMSTEQFLAENEMEEEKAIAMESQAFPYMMGDVSDGPPPGVIEQKTV